MVYTIVFSLFFSQYGSHRYLHSFPTRRSSDLFRDPKDTFRVVIVRDMWLTGFDAPSLHTMYVDKPMRGHGLMQAIARASARSEEHTSELQSRQYLVCRLLLEKKNNIYNTHLMQ